MLGAGASQAQTIESVLAPGLLIQGHAKVDHDCNACHSRFDRDAQTTLCIVCHKDVGEDIRLHTGLHGRREQQQRCRSCHTDHRGRAAQTAAFDHKTFDHRVTDFELRDKHVAVDCAKCHRPGKRWREASDSCGACHAKDDVHKGGLGPRCEDCHNARAWREVVFDHEKTRFGLSGKHRDAKCEGCHAKGRYKDTPLACIACHRKEDDHKGQYGEKCESCHDAKAWKPSSFNHDVDTRYVLKDKHRSTKCNACHTGPLYRRKLGSACIDCHAKDDKHKETLGRLCGDCHTERGWKDLPRFDHAKARFVLLGAHVKTPCKDCHADAMYRQTPGRCIDCHRKADKHQGNVGEACADCHAEKDWKTVHGRFDHGKTKFPLLNAHGARTVKCQDCHETLSAFRRTPTDCFACHRRDDKHEGTSGERCEQCHGDLNWRVARFDHARTRYALGGRHLVATCASCHPSRRFRDAPRDCLGCHKKEDAHKGTLGAACESCHNVRAWALWDFDHDRKTKYRLEGKHRQAKCLACHAKPAPAGVAIARVSTECLTCHQKNDVHEGRFGRRCEQCHATDDWRRVRPSTSQRSGTGPTVP
jgi:hypothetical protein